MEPVADKPSDLIIEPLTRGERKILNLLAEGLSNREIAEAETLALSTVKWYLRQIYGKLGANSRKDALEKAREAGLLTALAPPSPETRPKHNLPYQLTELIGREEEVSEVKALVAKRRLVTLTGTGGVGKTRLALQVGEDLLADYSDGAWFVELAPVSDTKLVAQAAAKVLGVREGSDAPLSTSLVEFLRQRQVLLVLDNCEHLVEACARLAEELLHGCREVHILITSREALRITGEAVYDVPPLPYPEAHDLVEVEKAPQFAAVRLFDERARAADGGFRVDETNLASVVKICQRLDGIPLAIELAAARVMVLTVEQMATRMEDVFRLLTAGNRTALPRHQTLQALIEWSYDLLTEAEKTVFRKLSVFAGGWSLAAAEAICAGSGTGSTDGLDLLSKLAEKSLIVREKIGKEVRFRMLETIRQYAGYQLYASEEVGEVRQRHLAYYLDFAEKIEKKLRTEKRLEGLEQFENELDNLRRALYWALVENPKENAEAGLRLASALREFWYVYGLYNEGREWIKECLELVKDGGEISEHALARAYYAIGYLEYHWGDITEARRAFETGAPIYRKLRDERGLAEALAMLPHIIYFQDNEAEAARAMMEESVRLARQAGDQWTLGSVLFWASVTAGGFDDDEAVERFAEESIPAFLASGNRWSANAPMQTLAWLALKRGDYIKARDYYQRALELSREGKDKFGIMSFLTNLGTVAYCLGDFQQTEALFRESLAIARETNGKNWEKVALLGMGTAAYRLGRFGRAAELILEALSSVQITQDRYDILTCLIGLAGIALGTGNAVLGTRWLGTASLFLEPKDKYQLMVSYAEYERGLAEARACLEEVDFEQAWSEGRQMSLEQALAEGRVLAEQIKQQAASTCVMCNSMVHS